MTAEPRVSGSLRSRLVLSLIGGAAVLALLLFVAIRNYAAGVAQQGQDLILRASVTSILDAAALREGQAEIDIPYAAFSMLGTEFDDRVFYAITQDDGFLSGYADLAELPALRDIEDGAVSVLYRGDRVRVAVGSRVLIGAASRSTIRVAVAQTQDALAGRLDEIARNAALIGAGFFALAVALSIWATSATIGQLDRLTASVTRRGPQDLSPFEKPVPIEMGPLVGSLNSLMGRLDHSLRQSEDFIAEAAHRVRTPLATVRSHAEATLQRVDREENRQALRAMVRALDESSRAATQLLDHAMITFRADHLERQPLDLAALAGDLVQRLSPIAEMKDLELRLEGEAPVACAGDPILLQNALRNLIDNAVKFSPAESVISIRVTADPPAVAVCDRGPGFPEDEIGDLAQRFRRGRNAGGIIGSGLGLTIASDVARAHGGTLTLLNRKGGGACACLSL